MEDACNTLVKIKKLKEVKAVKKADFHEFKTNEKSSRETKEGQEDKFMMMIRHKKTNKTLEKFHLTAIIDRSIRYPDKNTGNVKYSYKETDHSRWLHGHARLSDSRVIEAASLEEAQKIFHNEIKLDMDYEEYSSLAGVNVDSIQFIDDPVVGSQMWI
jgi:hypothetical protein